MRATGHGPRRTRSVTRRALVASAPSARSARNRPFARRRANSRRFAWKTTWATGFAGASPGHACESLRPGRSGGCICRYCGSTRREPPHPLRRSSGAWYLAAHCAPPYAPDDPFSRRAPASRHVASVRRLEVTTHGGAMRNPRDKRLYWRGGKLWCRVPGDDGRIIRRATRCTDETAATARADEFERRYANPRHAAAAAATLEGSVRALQLEMMRRGRSKETVAIS